MLRILNDLVDLFFWQTENFSQFPYVGPALISGMGAEQTNVIGVVFAENIIVDVVSVTPGEIHVKIRGRGPLWVEKALKIQVQFDRVRICDTQAISDQTVCTTAPTYIFISLLAGMPYDIVADEIICFEVFVGDDIKFTIEALSADRIVSGPGIPSFITTFSFRQ